MAHDEPDTVHSDHPLVEMATTIIPPKRKRTFKDAPPLIKPEHGQRETTEMALRLATAKREVHHKEIQKYSKDSVSYVECSRSDCLGPGIWIYGNAEEVPLKSTNWESAYKSRQSGWPDTTRPWCQCCETRGLRTTLRGVRFVGKLEKLPDDSLDMVPYALYAHPRFIRTLTSEETVEFWKSKE